MSALPTTAAQAPSALPALERRPLPGAAALAWAGRTTMLLVLALLVPGEAARIGADLSPRRD